MRFLGIGDDNSLADMYLRLIAAGHAVKVFVKEPDNGDKLAGMVDRVADWRAELDWIKQAGPDGIIVFETADGGFIQDQLRSEGFNVIGGSAFGDRLENDRAFGQQCMREAGMNTAGVHNFTDFDAAIAFIDENPNRYVFKLNGQLASPRNFVGISDDGTDVRAILEQQKNLWTHADTPRFILMEHVSGVEIGVGAYFNGEAFLDAVCLDWEHKRFFNGDLGELTGEMGTLVSYRNAEPLFSQTLAKMAGPLRESGYVGYINLNTIVNRDGIWPLEFTCRFGYPGSSILEALHEEGWDTLFARMIARQDTHFPTLPGYAIGVLLTVPPFPYASNYPTLSKGLPIVFAGDLTDDDRRHLHLDEVELRDGRLVTSGTVGSILVVTGRGATVDEARTQAYRLARRVVIPNVRYRSDIGHRFMTQDRQTLETLGLIPA